MADSGHKVAFSILSGRRDKEATAGSMDAGRIGKEGRKESRQGASVSKVHLGFPFPLPIMTTSPLAFLTPALYRKQDPS